MDSIVYLCIVLVSAFILGELAYFLRLPRVLGYLIGGFILAGAGLSGLGDATVFLKDLGIVVLFFFVGLGVNLKFSKGELKRSACLGFWTSIIPFIFGMGFCIVSFRRS